MVRLVMTMALWAAGACASGGGSDGGAQSAPAASGRECLIGVVVPEGMAIAPRTLLRPEQGDPVEMVGELVGNVRLLARTTVRVCGPGRTPGGALRVTEVALVSVDGMPARLGTLRWEGSVWLLEPLFEGELAVPVTDVPTALQEEPGEVVWVAGPIEAGRIAVRSYGVLEGWR